MIHLHVYNSFLEIKSKIIGIKKLKSQIRTILDTIDLENDIGKS